MRKSFIAVCIIILAFCFLLLLCRKQKIANSIVKTQASQTNTQIIDQSEQPKKEESPNINSVPNTATIPHRPTQEEISNIQQEILTDWQRPIEFYGKVVDENSNPVNGANITFGWSETPYESGEMKATTQSDAEGLFSLHGKHGPSLEVWFSKEGYYSSQHGQMGFLYSHSNDKYVPNPLNPVVFHLKKKGEGVELITSQNGMRPNVWVRLPKDGTSVRVDFFQKQASATGQLEIMQIKPPFQNATNWSFSLSIPDGGLVENQDEFQFEAPESGYQPTVEYDFEKDETNWTTQVTKQFYIVFGQPRKYGWLRIESNLAQETIFLTYAINPTGSQNLEPIQ